MNAHNPAGGRRRQDGLITREQALLAGVTRAEIDGHIRRRRWRRILPQVYVAGAGLLTSHLTVKAERIIAAASSGGHSPGERLLHRLLARAGSTGWTGWTGWTANEDILLDGAVKRPDVRFDRLRLVIEFDGFAFHTDHAVFENDRDRQHAFDIGGWIGQRFTCKQLNEQPDRVTAQISADAAGLLSVQPIST